MSARPRTAARFPAIGLAFLLLLGLASPATGLEQTNLPLLTTAIQVHQLSSEQAALRYPVRVRGTITFVDDSLGQLFVQDDTAGIFVEIQGDYGFRMQTGQVLEIEGVSAPGGFAPDIVPQTVKLVGEAPLPPARKVTYDQMAAGQQDCNRVEFGGIVRAVRLEPQTWAGLDIAAGGGRVIVAIGKPDPETCQRLVDAEVTVRGVCIAQFNRKGQLIQVALQAPGMADISVVKPAPEDPFAAPRRKCSRLLEYSPNEEHGHRVKVRGVVTFQQPGQALFLADETQGLCVETRQTTPVEPGDVVEVLGFPAAGEYVSPVLQDAVFRKVGRAEPVQAIPIRAEDGQRDTNNAALVQVEAWVLNRAERFHEQTLQLRSDNVVFEARLAATPGQPRRLTRIPDGSRVRLTGICLVPADLSLLTTPRNTFSLLLRSAADVAVLERPSWWTVRHTLWLLAGTLTVVFASLAWVAVLRSQVKAQTQLIRQKAQREAALEERTRIARDLHDELGSSLTQIALLSDRPRNASTGEVSENIRKISATAREMAQSLDEIVWAVNPQHDTLEGLVEYFSQTADDFLEETNIRSSITLPSSLPGCTIPAEARHQLFLAFKEALNNAVRHAGASEIRIGFDINGSEFRVQICDNGNGFDPDSARPGGSGIKNMRQRLDVIGGRFEISSARGQGATVVMSIPVPSANAEIQNPKAALTPRTEL